MIDDFDETELPDQPAAPSPTTTGEPIAAFIERLVDAHLKRGGEWLQRALRRALRDESVQNLLEARARRVVQAEIRTHFTSARLAELIQQEIAMILASRK